MTARAAVQTLLADDEDLAALGVEKVYAAGSVDTPAEECFLVVRWDPDSRVFGTTGSGRVLVWAHDKNRDYGRITDVLQRVKAILTAATHVAGSDGWTLTQADWRNDSVDLKDNVFDTVTRWAAFDIAARPTT